ncbi:MAG: hypothetical protein MJ160_05635 [Treponema sp.]|nr:hypothetical protein [Treponema sp.]
MLLTVQIWIILTICTGQTEDKLNLNKRQADMELVQIEKDIVRLNSRMEELSFSKTNYDSVVTQQGLLATAELTSKDKPVFDFNSWSFSEIKSFDVEGCKNPIVFYCGNQQFSENAKTLSSFENKDFFLPGYYVCSLLTQAAIQNIKVPMTGAGGIIVDITDTKVTILMLPEDLYKYSVGGLPAEDALNLQGGWINSTIYDLPALCFLRGVISYKMITGNLPYPEPKDLERNADILDSKFLPVNLCVNGINKNLSAEINKALKLNSSLVNIPGKKRKGKGSEDLTPTAHFPLELLYTFKDDIKESKLSEEAFAEKKDAFLKRQNSAINTKRKIRRNSTTIIVTLAILITIGLVTRSSIKGRLDNYTSKGLTSQQTVEAFMVGINDKDTVLLDYFADGKQLSRYIDSIANIYVISKVRENYNKQQGFLNPERWIIAANSDSNFLKAALYGITGLYIDGQYYDLNPSLKKRNENPVAVTNPDGTPIQKGTKVTHQIQYNLLRTDGEFNDIFVERTSGTVTLTFKKDRWVLTSLDTTEEIIPVDTESFKMDYFTAIAEADGEVFDAIPSMLEKYDWLPSFSGIMRQREKLLEEIEKFSFSPTPVVPR